MENLILKIDNDTSVFADKHQYYIRNGKNYSYFSSLEDCFQEIFEMTIKDRLLKNENKNLEAVLEILKSTKAEITSLFKF